MVIVAVIVKSNFNTALLGEDFSSLEVGHVRWMEVGPENLAPKRKGILPNHQFSGVSYG